VRAARASLCVLGALTAAYGAWLLWDRQRPDQVWAVVRWFVGGVVLHDVAVAAVVLLAGLALTRWVPPVARAPVAVGAVVLSTVTVVAVPVLLSYGRKADNPTLLDRDYGTGWLVLAGVVVLTTAVAVLVRSRRDGGPDR
jgi:hypothetical protein